ncbi:MAG TPA: S24 family peptidase [Candidatus Paceibacterota bacterium]
MSFGKVAEEELTDVLTIDEYLIENRQATYLLEVEGDAMVDSCIQNGDLVIVERGRQPRPGDIVIVTTDDGWGMRHYPQGIGPDMHVSAVVRGVVRKY